MRRRCRFIETVALERTAVPRIMAWSDVGDSRGDDRAGNPSRTRPRAGAGAVRAMTDDTVSIVSDDDGALGPARAGPCLFLVFECGRPLAGSTRHELRDVDEVIIGRAPVRHHARELREDRSTVLTLGVPDPRMSHPHARLVVDAGRWVLEDRKSKNGVVLNGERHSRALLDDGDLFDLGHSVFLFRDPAAYDELGLDRDSSELLASPPGLATFVPGLRRVFEDLARISPEPAPVLLQGETGTGKEVVARAVHTLSGRHGPFVAVNCGALPATLVESQLFGHRKGAFSGATEDSDGFIRSADRGTLFLDEIGDLPLPSQAALLRVLQEHEVTPVGATRPIRVDLKVVAATHRDLEGLVEAGKFREDLYSRIAGLVVHLPPLRERREDLGLLIAAILGRIAAAVPPFSVEAARALMRHAWHHNIRGLDNALRLALPLANGGPVGLAHLPESVRSGPTIQTVLPRAPAADRKTEIESLLREHGGNISAVARKAGVSRIQVHRWLKRYDLDPSRYR